MDAPGGPADISVDSVTIADWRRKNHKYRQALGMGCARSHPPSRT